MVDRQIHNKECGRRIKYLVLKFNHDQFNWSQEALIVAIDILNMDSKIDLEKNRIDAVIPLKNEILNLEHKFIGLLTKKSDYTNRIINKVKNQIERKNLNLIIITTLTSKHSMTDDLLLNFDVCLHVISISGEYMASTKSDNLTKEILNAVELGMDMDEEMITPIQAQMMIVLENQQNQSKANNEDLKKKINNLEKSYEELKEGNEELKNKINELSEFIYEKLK